MRQKKKLIDIEILNELLEYNPETGQLFWKFRDRKWFPTEGSYNSWNKQNAGKEAFTAKSYDYYVGTLLKVVYFKHIIAFALYNQRWPTHQVDHRDEDKSNNRSDNLREATHAQNQQNRSLGITNTSGFKGVTWNKRKSKWQAQIRIDGKQTGLGYFHDKLEAARAYNQAATKVHGEFASLNALS